MSRVLEPNATHVSTGSYGTVAYMPAEMLKKGKMTKAVDVYSFAIIMLELFMGDLAFRGMSSSQARAAPRLVHQLDRLARQLAALLLSARSPSHMPCRAAAACSLIHDSADMRACEASPTHACVPPGLSQAAMHTPGRSLMVGCAQVFFKVLMGYRPPIPDNMPQGFKDLLVACWVRSRISVLMQRPASGVFACCALHKLDMRGFVTGCDLSGRVWLLSSVRAGLVLNVAGAS